MSRLVLCLLLASLASAQSPVRSYVDSRQPEILQEFSAFLSIPNVASDSRNIRRNAEALLGIDQPDPILGTLGSCKARFDGREIELER